MLPAVVFALLLAGAVGFARLAFRSRRPEYRLITTGLLAVTAAVTLWIPAVGEQTVDRTTRFLGANTSDTGQHLLTVVACYCWVAATVTDDCPPRGLWIWRAATLLTLAALIATYLLSDGVHTPADEFALQDPASRAHHWLVPLFMLATFAMLLRAALAQRHDHGIDYKVSLAAMVLVAIIGLTVSVVTAFLLAAHPLWLADHYHDLARIGIVPALLALGAAGIPGVIQEWQTRDDPR